MGEVIRYDAQTFVAENIIRVLEVQDYRIKCTLFLIPVISLYLILDDIMIVLRKIKQQLTSLTIQLILPLFQITSLTLGYIRVGGEGID